MRKTKEIVIAVAKVAQKNTNLVVDEQSKEFWRWKDNMLTLEETMLELLTFDLVVDKPHEYLYKYLKHLNIENNKSLRNVCWAFLNDSCMTMLCLLMPASDIAVASIYFATKFLGETIPDDEHGMPWWVALNRDPVRIVQAVGVMTQFWQENPLKRSENPYADSPPSTNDLDHTRRRNSNASVDSHEDGTTPAKDLVSPPKEEVTPPKIQGSPAKEELTPKDEASPVKKEGVKNDKARRENGEVKHITVPLTNGEISKVSPSKRKSLEDKDGPEAKRAKIDEAKDLTF